MQAEPKRLVFGEVPIHGPTRRRASVYAVPLDDRARVAVFKLDVGYYLFGGGIDAGETPEDALLREILEECGHTARIERALHFSPTWPNPATAEEVTQWVHPKNNAPLAKDSVFYVVSLGARVTDPIEVDHDLLWVDAHHAIPHMRDASQAHAIKRAIDSLPA